MDSTLLNPAPHIQKNSAYRQIDFVSKTRYSPNNVIDLYLNLQASTSSDIDRFDQLNDYNGDNLKYAEWYYGPQNRILASVQGAFKNYNPFYTNGTATIAFQKISEDRISRKFRVDDKLFQEEDVFVYSGNLDFTKVLKKGCRLYYGIEVTHNDVRSDARYENIRNSGLTPEPPPSRYPGGGSHTNSFAVYGSYRMYPSDKIILNTGLRYQYGTLRSKFTDPRLPIDEIRINSGAPTISVSLVYTPAPTWQYDFILATGFRNPNVDDYGKVRAKGDYITVPNKDLKFEYSYNAEIGISKNIPGIITLSGSVYFTYLTNAIVRSNFTLNNSDSLFYDGEYYRIITNANAGLATIQGVSLNARSDLPGRFFFKGTFNYLKGTDITNDVPLGHIPPMFGKFSLGHHFRKFTNEAYVYYSGKKYWSDMTPFGEDNEDEAIPDVGYPAWYTINLRSHYKISERFEVQIQIENILDRFYKTFASGIAATGRNFILTLRAVI
jgi:hemoglobin/transferrin/lactoferrin receptor protein